jgi:hypothetical protein
LGSRRRIFLQGLLQPAEQRRRARLEREADRHVAGAQPELQLAGVPTEAGEQRVPYDVGRWVGPAAGPLVCRDERRDRVPQRGGWVRQPQVDLAGERQRGDDLELGGGQPGRAEE